MEPFSLAMGFDAAWNGSSLAVVNIGTPESGSENQVLLYFEADCD